LFGSNVSVGFSVVSLSLGNPQLPLRYILGCHIDQSGKLRLSKASDLAILSKVVGKILYMIHGCVFLS